MIFDICTYYGRPDLRARFSLQTPLEDERPLILPILINIKTHKNPGSVVPRIIHGGGSFIFEALGRFVSSQIKPLLRARTHLLKDTDALIKKIQTLDIDDDDMLFTFDIHSFYLSGSHETLAEDVAWFFDGDLALLMKRAVYFILTNQYVAEDPANCQDCYQVVSGSGMGINCSGDVANLVFYKQQELNFALDVQKQREYSIKLYTRYEDDGFVIFGRGSRRYSWIADWRDFAVRRRSSFLVDKWNGSLESVEVLDLTIAKPADNSRRLQYWPYFKATSLGVPLGTRSAHPFSLHRS